jgi:hypothetical protein
LLVEAVVPLDTAIEALVVEVVQVVIGPLRQVFLVMSQR